MRELEREERYAAASLDQDCFTGCETALRHQRAPRRQRGARQGRGGLEGEVRGHVYPGRLGEDDLLGEHAVLRAAEGARVVIFR